MSRLCFNDCCVKMVCCRCEYCWQFVRVTYRSTIWQLFCTFPQFNKMVLFFLYESRNLEPYFNFFKMINYQLLSNLLHKTVKSFKKGIYLVQCNIWIFTFHLKYFGIPEIYWKLTCKLIPYAQKCQKDISYGFGDAYIVLQCNLLSSGEALSPYAGVSWHLLTLLVMGWGTQLGAVWLRESNLHGQKELFWDCGISR